MTISEYQDKWNRRFADNDQFLIDEADLREFKDDTAQLLAASGGQGQGITELLVPMAVTAGAWYVTPLGLWEARSSFNAAAAPFSGPNWRRLVNFSPTITAASILDASPAGRSLLTAINADAQLAQLDHLDIAATATHPAFARAYTPAGGIAWLFNAVGGLLSAPAAPQAPGAPTDPLHNDVSDTFSGVAATGYSSYAEYEATGLPGTTGVVPLTPDNSFQVGNRIYLKNLYGPLLPNTVGFRVAASGNRPAGAFLMNTEAFTGVVPAPKGYQKLYTDKYPAAA